MRPTIRLPSRLLLRVVVVVGFPSSLGDGRQAKHYGAWLAIVVVGRLQLVQPINQPCDFRFRRWINVRFGPALALRGGQSKAAALPSRIPDARCPRRRWSIRRLDAAAYANGRLPNEAGSRVARLAVYDDAFAVVHRQPMGRVRPPPLAAGVAVE